MKIINLNTGEGYKSITFPDGQPHVVVDDLLDEYIVQVICSITSPAKLIELCEIGNVLNRKALSWELHIPYLMAARYDRIMQEDGNDSFDLLVVASIINGLECPLVTLYDPHSDVAPALIKNCQVVNNRQLVEAYDKEDAILIIPDAGAAKKAHKYLEWNSNIRSTVQCIKHRELKTGKITLEVLQRGNCKGEHCVIIDDLCDGGATFNAIAEQIDPLTLTLIVSHGIFSKGLLKLSENFDEIITSDSYYPPHRWTQLNTKPAPRENLVKVIPWINS